MPVFGLPCDCVKYYVLPGYIEAVYMWVSPRCRMTNYYLELKLTDGGRVKVYLKGNQTIINFWVRTMQGQTLATGRI